MPAPNPPGKPFRRVVLIVLDSVGIGEMPDAAAFGDAGSDTLGHGAASRAPRARPAGAFGKAALASNGKDTTTGHWELAGIYLKDPFPTYPHGFPGELIGRFEKAIGRRGAGAKAAAGAGE